MDFSCDNCQRRYSIADEKVRGRRVRVKCKACGEIVAVGPLEEEAAPPPEEERTRMVAVDDLERLRAQAARPAKEPRGAAKQTPFDDEPTRAVSVEEAGALWFAMIKGVQEGPYDTSALRARVFAGDIGPKTYVWKNGMADWKRAAELPEIAGLMKPATQSRPAARKTAVRPPPSDAPGISVTASQILDTSDVQHAVDMATQPGIAGPYSERKSTAELDAGDLFSGLELSKIVKNPLLQQPLEIQNDEGADGLGSPPEGSLLDSEVRSAERPDARDEDGRGNGLRRGLAAALVLVVVGLGLFGAARAGLLPAGLLAIAGLGGTSAPEKAAPPAKGTHPVKPASPEPGARKPAPEAAPASPEPGARKPAPEAAPASPEPGGEKPASEAVPASPEPGAEKPAPKAAP